jgi:hypothetical protein
MKAIEHFRIWGVLVLLCAAGSAQSKQPADLIISGGIVVTMD